MSCRRATARKDAPLAAAYSTIRSFCSSPQRRRRPVWTTSIRLTPTISLRLSPVILTVTYDKFIYRQGATHLRRTLGARPVQLVLANIGSMATRTTTAPGADARNANLALGIFAPATQPLNALKNCDLAQCLILILEPVQTPALSPVRNSSVKSNPAKRSLSEA